MARMKPLIFFHRGPRVGHKVFRFAVFLADGGDAVWRWFPGAGGIARREDGFGVMTPKLA